MRNKTVVILAGKGDSTQMVYHALREEFHVARVILEEPVPTGRLLVQRAATTGWMKVLGQLLFQVAVEVPLQVLSEDRHAEIRKEYGLLDRPVDPDIAFEVESANGPDAIRLLQDINPDVVVVNGTRLLSKQVLSSIKGTFLALHAGINPLYRGLHGGYWALAHLDAAHCGVTVHLVEPDSDTGTVLHQATVTPSKKDNLTTYPLLLLAAGIPLLKRAIRDVFEDNIQLKKTPAGPSHLWSHPTLWQYLKNRITKGVK